jgi:hypothetical protein
MQGFLSHHEVAQASSTSSDTALKVARKWLSNCCTNHNTCELMASQASRRYLPERLIGIRRQPDSDWRLVLDTQSLPENTTYMTLSHRWGVREFLNLTTETMSLLVSGMALNGLPQTFQDAIYVVKKLRCDYLWIDSLCILQGNDEKALRDWQAQSRAMRHVYANSKCNIAATQASDCSRGLFSSRVPTDVHPPTLNIANVMEGGQVEYVIHDIDFWREHIEKSPLIERAWVLQERLLAPRTIHFAEKQLFFECNEVNACESFPRGMPDVIFGVRRASIKVDSVFTSYTLPDGNNNVGMDEHLFWDSVVSIYAGRDLTKSGDKLVALSGIASMSQAITKDNYYAGLWESRFCTQLLWSILGCRRSNSELSQRPSEYRAPSWSWASLDGRLYWAQMTLDRPPLSVSLVKVLSVETFPLTTETTGQLSGGYCLLRGVLRQADVYTDSSRNSALTLEGSSELLGFLPDVAMPEGKIGVVCLPVGQYMLGPGPVTVERLVLSKGNTGEDKFSRIGHFRCQITQTLVALGMKVGKHGGLCTWCTVTSLQTVKII